MSDAVETVLGVLEANGFERLPRPLVVAGSSFDFDAAVRGTGPSHDLVLVATRDTTSQRLSRLLSGLGRTLDLVQSRRPVTLVLVGALDESFVRMDLERHARLLAIDSESPSAQAVRDAIAVLLPLELPAAARQGREPLDEVVSALGTKLSAEHHQLIANASIGASAVREGLRDFIDRGIRDEQANGPTQ